jgi:hypothetical protein
MMTSSKRAAFLPFSTTAPPVFLIIIVAAQLQASSATNNNNCTCFNHTDFQCVMPTPPCKDIAVHDAVNSSDACADLCLTNPRCHASAWNGASDDHFNQCYLKGQYNLSRTINAITTGCVCRGPPPPLLLQHSAEQSLPDTCPVPLGSPAVHKGQDFGHPDLELNTSTNITSYSECCSLCSSAPKCYALTWVGKDSATHPNTCWLRAGVGPLMTHPHPVTYSAIMPGRKPCLPPGCTFPKPPSPPKPPPPPPPKPGGCVHLHGVCSRTVHCCGGLKCNGSGGQYRCRNK